MNLATQTIILFAITLVGFQLFILSPSKPPYQRELRSSPVNFLLFIFICTTFVVLLGVSFHHGRGFYLLIIAATVSLSVVLLLIVWVVPFLVAPVTDHQDTKRIMSESAFVPKQRPLALKLLYSSILFLLPLLMLAHVHRNGDSYISDLADYDKYVTRQWTGTEDPTLTGKPVVSVQANTFPKTISAYAAAFYRYFLTTANVPCPDNDPNCKALQNRLSLTQNSRALFVAKTLYYFLVFYLIFRYYTQSLQISYYENPNEQNLGLRQDVIKQCSQIGSVAAAFMLALILAGVDFTSLGVFGGLIGAGLSVALKDVLGNLVAGILLLWDKTIKKKDVITIGPSDSNDTGATYAIVEKMTMRYTVVQDRNEVRRLIPNSLLTNSIVENWTHEDNKVRLRVLVGVDYGTDLRLARTILESVCYEVDRIYTKDRFAPKAVVLGFGDSSINFALRFWIEDAQRGIRPILSDLYIAIYERLTEENIKIPYPRRDLHIVSSETVRQQLKA